MGLNDLFGVDMKLSTGYRLVPMGSGGYKHDGP